MAPLTKKVLDPCSMASQSVTLSGSCSVVMNLNTVKECSNASRFETFCSEDQSILLYKLYFHSLRSLPFLKRLHNLQNRKTRQSYESFTSLAPKQLHSKSEMY